MRRWVVTGAVFVSGFAGMSGAAALLLSYHVGHGLLPGAFSTLVAVCMLGLAAGARLTGASGMKVHGLVHLRLFMVAMCGLDLTVCSSRPGWLFGAAFFFSAMVLGSEFPVALEVLGKGGGTSLCAAAGIGAAVGAYLSVGWLIPLYGTNTLFMLLAGIHTVTSVALGVALLPGRSPGRWVKVRRGREPLIRIGDGRPRAS